MRQRDILLFWLPLFASWLLMTAEGPIISAAINRLPDEVIMLAAQGIVMSLSVTIESPIINMLATSTALAKDRPSYLLLRRFTFHWMVGLTLVATLLAYTPLFDLVVIRWMAVPLEVAGWVRPGMQIMIPWSAAIGWRRFLQGVLIRFRQTRKVAWGTVVRLVASAGVVIGLAVWSNWPGVIIAATALVAGVTAEALYATYAVRPILANELGPDRAPATGPPLTYRELFWFHLPLAATSVLILLVQPLVTFSLARLDQPTLSLAAWPLVFQVMLIARAPAMALPEVIIALSEGEATFRPLRHFTRNLVIANTLLILLFVFTPLVNFYLLTVQDTTPPVAELARRGLHLFFLLPAVYILISWVRGLLISNRTTRLVNAGMAVNLVLTGLVLLLGIWLRWPGIETAAVALTAAAAVEFAFLWWQSRTILGFRLTLADSRDRKG
jgi:progressive ankylosis protein